VNQDVIDDARNVWLYGSAPQFTEEQYSEALVAVFEELLARGRRRGVLDEPRVAQLLNARQRLSEVPQ
jgi:hypothetical protein